MTTFDLDDELGPEPPDGPDPEPAELTGAEDANRMMRRLRAAERQAAEVLALAAADMADVQAWRDAKLQGIASTVSWCRRSLEGWIRKVHAESGRQSVKLPAGTVALRKGQPRLELPPVETAEQAAAWTAIAEGAVTTTWKLAKRELAAVLRPGPKLGPPDPEGYQAHQAVNEAGEAVPGAVLHVPGRLGFSAKPAASIEDLDAELEDGEA